MATMKTRGKKASGPFGPVWVPEPYLPDATNFDDIPLMPNPGNTYPDKAGYIPCPKCHGHGKWNLRLAAYNPRPGETKREHFMASCGNCWGWGWVAPASTDATCLHDFVGIAPDMPWRCWHTIKCTKCGTTRSYSSDD